MFLWINFVKEKSYKILEYFITNITKGSECYFFQISRDRSIFFFQIWDGMLFSQSQGNEVNHLLVC